MDDTDGADNPLVARFMVERATEAEALPDAQMLRLFLQGYGDPGAASIERYWKIPELVEIAFLLKSAARNAAFAALVDALATECVRVDDEHTPWMVWDTRNHPPLKPADMRSVRWINIE